MARAFPELIVGGVLFAPFVTYLLTALVVIIVLRPLPSAIAFERPACPNCKARMMLVSIEPERLGVDLHTYQCAVCNHVLTTLAAYEDPMHSKDLGRWLLGDLHPRR